MKAIVKLEGILQRACLRNCALVLTQCVISNKLIAPALTAARWTSSAVCLLYPWPAASICGVVSEVSGNLGTDHKLMASMSFYDTVRPNSRQTITVTVIT